MQLVKQLMCMTMGVAMAIMCMTGVTMRFLGAMGVTMAFLCMAMARAMTTFIRQRFGALAASTESEQFQSCRSELLGRHLTRRVVPKKKSPREKRNSMNSSSPSRIQKRSLHIKIPKISAWKNKLKDSEE